LITSDEIDSIEDGNFCFLNGEINSESSDYVVRFILMKNLEKKADKLNIIINSSGGEMVDSFAIIDIMKASRIPIHTYGIGHCSSAALFIFMAGQKGNRYSFPHTVFMSHQWSSTMDGKAFEHKAIVKGNKLASDMILNHYVECTGLSKNIINKKLLPPNDVYLSSQEALKFKFCDKIVTTFQEK
jgi:ATP-dependent Clp protease protease subunit